MKCVLGCEEFLDSFQRGRRDSHVPTRVVEGVLQPVAPTTTEQRLAQKIKLKARGTLLMALPDKHLLKFNSHKDAKTLMEAIKKRFGGNTQTKKVQKTLLKQQFENFTGSSSKVTQSSSTSTASQNLAFVSSSQTDSTTDSVSATASVSAIYAKLPASPLPNADSLSNAIDVDGIKEMDLRWQIAMLTIRARRRAILLGSVGLPRIQEGLVHYDWSYQAEEEPTNFALMAFSSSSSSTDNETGLESVETRLLVYKQNESVFEENIKLLNIEVQLRDTALLTLRQKLEKVEKDRDDLKLKHSVQPIETTILAATPAPASPTSNSSGKRRNRKACFVCKSVDHLIKDCDFHTKQMAQPTQRNYAHRGHNKHYYQLTHSKPQKHMVPTAVLTQSKPLSNTAVRPVSTALSNITMTQPRHDHHVVTKFKSPIRRHITRSPSSMTRNSPPRVTVVQALVVSAAQGNQGTWGNPQQALKDKGVIDSGCSRHMTGNMSYLSKFKELNGGYVTFRGNPKGGKITGKGKIKTGKLDFDDVYFVKELKFNLFSVSQMCDKKNSVLFTDTKCLVVSPNFKLSDESQVLLKVPREKNMYNVNLKNIVPSGDLTCLFAKATNHKSNKWHRRLGHIHFKTINKLVKGNLVRGLPIKVFENVNTCVACKKGKQHRASCKFQGKVDEGFLVGYFVCSKAFMVFNSRTRIIQETLHVNFLENKPNVAVFQDKFDAEKAGEEVDQTYVLFLVWSVVSTNPHNNDEDVAFDGKEHDFDATKLESVVILSSSSSDQSRKQDDKTKKEDKGKIPTVGQNTLNITNTFNVVGPSNTTVSLTYGKSSSIDASQLPDDPDMPELEDITYSDDEDVVGAKVDFNNLESSIPKVWVLLDQPYGKRAIGTKWVYRNKKDERGIVIRNKARPVTQGHTQEDGIDYEEVFAPIARIKAIRLFLAYASFMGFMVYQMDVKNAFLYGTIEEVVYVYQPSWFEDPDHPDKVYKVVKALYGLHQALRAWYELWLHIFWKMVFKEAQ
nr:ribonuclease H-like domain-containing protein [Tanacetum cinerariifolium]